MDCALPPLQFQIAFRVRVLPGGGAAASHRLIIMQHAPEKFKRDSLTASQATRYLRHPSYPSKLQVQHHVKAPARRFEGAWGARKHRGNVIAVMFLMFH